MNRSEIKPVPDEEYPDYHTREQVKHDFYSEYPNATLEEKAWLIVHKLIWAHYWRSRPYVEDYGKRFLKKIYGNKYYPGRELEFDTYANHWLGAEVFLPDEKILKKIEKNWGYKPEKHPLFAKGHSSYQPNW